jgi:hypothetical protein
MDDSKYLQQYVHVWEVNEEIFADSDSNLDGSYCDDCDNESEVSSDTVEVNVLVGIENLLETLALDVWRTEIFIF